MKPALLSPNRHIIPLILLFALGICSLYADGVRWTITTVEIATEGSTRESVLRRVLGLEEGKTFGSLEDLQAYLDDKRQVLAGIRLFQSSSLDFKIGEMIDSVFPVAVSVHTKDTWNIIALPYPRYDSNEGFRLSVKFRNYNAFGSMEPLNVDVDYILSTAGENTVGTSLAFTLPLDWQDESWAFFTSHSFLYSFAAPFTYQGFVGIRKIFDWAGFDSHLQFRQGFITKDLDSDDDSDWYARTEASTYARFSLFPDMANGTGYASTELAFGMNYNPLTGLPTKYSGVDLRLSSGLGFGRVDWKKNFREGWLAAAENIIVYRFSDSDFQNLTTATFRIDMSLIPDLLGTGIRLVGVGSYPDPEDNLGSYLRGVRNDGIEADLGAFANFSLIGKLFDFLPSRYISISWLDMEVQSSVFFDAGLVRESTDRMPELHLSSGLEFFAFPRAARSMFARISAGFDILHYAESDNLASALEVFFGLGSHY